MSAFDPSTSTIKVFDYIEALDAFVATREFTSITERLGIFEWSPVVWLGRLFTMDNDFGEHWFDNDEEREAITQRAESLGYDAYYLLVLKPSRLKDGRDGPCHSDAFRQRFWTDVLRSLRLSLDLIFDEARAFNAERRRDPDTDDPEVQDLEQRISAIRQELGVAS